MTAGFLSWWFLSILCPRYNEQHSIRQIAWEGYEERKGKGGGDNKKPGCKMYLFHYNEYKIRWRERGV